MLISLQVIIPGMNQLAKNPLYCNYFGDSFVLNCISRLAYLHEKAIILT